MLYQSCLAALLVLPGVLAKGTDRWVTFYSSNNCTFGFEEDDKSADIAMSAKECIREDGRQSFVPGTFDQPFGTWCYVYYEENDCDCVAGSRLIHVGGENGSIDCQKEDVGGYRSYHFEQLDPNLGCPTSGCYYKDGKNTVERTQMKL